MHRMRRWSVRGYIRDVGGPYNQALVIMMEMKRVV